MSIRFFAVVITLLVAPSISAGPDDTFTLQPSVILVAGVTQLRIDSADGCYPADGSQIEAAPGVIDVSFTIADFACLPAWSTPRFVALGPFPAGSYDVRITECTNAPIDPCTLRQTLQLTVGGGVPQATPVPAFSQLGAMLLALAIVVVASKRVRE
jgi:hypothetical protein